jgi:hypothetical protein
MQPRIEELLKHLREQRTVLQSATDHFPAALLDQRPTPERWSVANVLEHLAIIETRVAALLSSKISNARAEGLRNETETASVLDPQHRELFLDRTRRVDARDSGRPTGEMDAPTAWTALGESRRKLIDVVSAADGLALGEVMHAHPIVGPLNMYHWIAFVGWHEARHAAQIDEIGEALKRST